jgi:hypothetical protein
MTNPRRGLSHDPCELRKRGGGSHEQAQDVQPAGIGKELDLVERTEGIDLPHYG